MVSILHSEVVHYIAEFHPRVKQVSGATIYFRLTALFQLALLAFLLEILAAELD